MILKEDEEWLAHYGVKGMRWGVRNDKRSGVSRKVDRDAAKDAKETTRAKLYYGDGAGTRRKLIKATVEGKRKKDPEGYGKAFDRHLAEQDLSKHSSKAKSERKRTDRKEKASKRAGAIARQITGEWGTQAAFVALIAGGGAWLNSPKGRQFLNQTKRQMENKIDIQKTKRGADYLSDYFQRNS